MKWKRSKKAQQESKVNKESTDVNKIQISSSNSSSPTTKPGPSLSQESCINPIQPTENQTRKVQEGEPLYRPYVV